MTKKEFLNRCETAYDMGLTKDLTLNLMQDWCDAIMRYEAARGSTDNQFKYWEEFLVKERERTGNFANDCVLANDVEGYKIIQLTALLAHPCQKCAEDTDAWHTRSGWCSHKN